MKRESQKLLSGDILEEDVELTMAELCNTCQLPAEEIFTLVEFGIIEPYGSHPSRWRFSGICIHRIRCIQRLERDLGINTAGAALALDLLEEIDQLHAKLRRLES